MTESSDLRRIVRPLDRLIFESLLSGPKTRQDLCLITGQEDRVNRYAIERLRNQGIVIVSSSKGKGYRLAQTAEEVKSFVNDMESRAQKAWRTAGKVRRAYGLKDQLSIPNI